MKKEANTPHKPAKAKKTRSIARGINRSFTVRLLLIFILLDIIILSPELIALVESYAPITSEQIAAVFEAQRALLIAEAAVWVITVIFGAAGIRKKLRPLDEMASAAQFFTAPGGFDEAKFHDLESAIDSINPAREGSRIRTGDKELEGLEKAVNKLIVRMHDSYRQQSRFVSDASHELRTPIAVIQGYANMLDRWGKTDEKILNESIEAIKAESDRMKRMVEQLLFLARGDAGGTQIKTERLDLSVIMREVFDESVMIDPEHKYELIAPEPVPATGDADMLKQAARILVENAAKYTSPGESIILKAELRSGAPALTVQDYGIGMAQSDIPHVFERFYRADASRARESGGTGLGLAIAKWIADKHGGWFEVVSREELGTRISLCLPPPSDGSAARQGVESG